MGLRVGGQADSQGMELREKQRNVKRTKIRNENSSKEMPKM